MRVILLPLLVALSACEPINLEFGPCGILGCGPDLAGSYEPPPYSDYGDMSIPVFDCCALSATCPTRASDPFQPAPVFICKTPGFTCDCSCDNFGFVHCGAGDKWCNPLGYDLAARHDLAVPLDLESAPDMMPVSDGSEAD